MFSSRLFLSFFFIALFLSNEVWAQRKPELYVLSIGISDYKDNKTIRDLRFSKDDALAVSEAFGGQSDYYAVKKVITLVDSMATRQTILSAFDAFPAVPEDALFVFFYSGHGAEGSICPHDFDMDKYNNDAETTVLSEYTLTNKLKKLNCNTIAIYDACHSAAMVDKGFVEFDEESKEGGIVPEKIKTWLESNGRGLLDAFRKINKVKMAIGSSASDQKSYECHSCKHGFLTQALLDMFANTASPSRDGKNIFPDNNNDGLVSMHELQEYLFEAVVNMTTQASKQNGRIKPQTPWITMATGANLNLFVVGTPKNIETVPAREPVKPKTKPVTAPRKKRSPTHIVIPTLSVTESTIELPPLCDDPAKWVSYKGNDMVTLKINTTLGCCVRVDCEIADSALSSGRFLRLTFRKGNTYRLDFTNLENSADRIVYNYTPQNTFLDEAYSAALKIVQDNRIAKEEAEAERVRLYETAIQSANSAIQANDFDKAIGEFEYALQLNPNDDAIEEKLEAVREKKKEVDGINSQFEEAVTQGVKLFIEGNFEAAVTAYEQALELKPGNTEATQGLKKAQIERDFNVAMKNSDENMKKEDYEKAIQYYKEALKLKKDEPSALANLKKAETELNYRVNMENGKHNMTPTHYGAAIPFFEKALQAKPGDAKATLEMNKSIEAKRKEDEERERNYQESLREGDRAFEKGVTSQLAADFEAAHSAYEKALTFKNEETARKKDKNAKIERDYCIFIASGNLALGKKDWREAQEAFEKALGKKQSDPKATKKLKETMITEIQSNMVLVEQGSFQMGKDDNGKKTDPGHKVTVGSFVISRFEITRNQWKYFAGESANGHYGCVQCPVEEITYEETKEFLAVLSKETGENWRLPTEAEWEFAARGGIKSSQYVYAGSNDADAVAHFSKFLDKAHKSTEVGQQYSNEIGLYDMSGNVAEWCNDWFAPYSLGQSNNPTGPASGSERVIRGGGYNNKSNEFTVFTRRAETPKKTLKGVGFRIVKSMKK